MLDVQRRRQRGRRGTRPRHSSISHRGPIGPRRRETAACCVSPKTATAIRRSRWCSTTRLNPSRARSIPPISARARAGFDARGALRTENTRGCRESRRTDRGWQSDAFHIGGGRAGQRVDRAHRDRAAETMVCTRRQKQGPDMTFGKRQNTRGRRRLRPIERQPREQTRNRTRAATARCDAAAPGSCHRQTAKR